VWRNRSRADLRAAVRVAAVGYAASVAGFLMVAPHTLDAPEELGLLTHGFSAAAGWAVVLLVLYLALEPLMRRFWPHLLVSWSRAIAGRWRDPLVGRDLLGGCAMGMLGTLTVVGRYVLPERFGMGVSVFQPPSVLPLLGPLPFAGNLLLGVPWALQWALLWPFLLVLLRLLLRNRMLTMAAFVLVAGLSGSGLASGIDYVLEAVNALGFAVAVAVFGPLGLLAGHLVTILLTDVPIGAPVAFRGDALFATALVAALAGWAFATATRERSDA
jgi:hypothetical protein